MRNYLSQFPYDSLLIRSGWIWIIYIGYYRLKHKSYMGFRQLVTSGISVLYIVLFLQLYVQIPSYRSMGQGPWGLLKRYVCFLYSWRL